MSEREALARFLARQGNMIGVTDRGEDALEMAVTLEPARPAVSAS